MIAPTMIRGLTDDWCKTLKDHDPGAESRSQAPSGAGALLSVCVRPQKPGQEKADRNCRTQAL